MTAASQRASVLAHLEQMLGDERLGVEPASAPQTVVVELGWRFAHRAPDRTDLRVTLVGDALARLLRFLGTA